MSNNNLKSVVNQSYWDSSYSEFVFHEGNDALTEWLEKKYIFNNNINSKSVFEVGCFPGRYLINFGRKGMELNGIDLTPNISRLANWLYSQNLNVKNIISSDFFEYKTEYQYDLVCSFGFIEHYTAYSEVILKHIPLVKEGGTIIITTPNFRGLGQHILHQIFDNENLKRHNINSMKPFEWAKLLEAHGFQILNCEYFGKFDFWHDSKITGLRLRLRLLYFKYIHSFLIQHIKFNSSYLSPYCGIIAIKSSL